MENGRKAVGPWAAIALISCGTPQQETVNLDSVNTVEEIRSLGTFLSSNRAGYDQFVSKIRSAKRAILIDINGRSVPGFKYGSLGDCFIVNKISDYDGDNIGFRKAEEIKCFLPTGVNFQNIIEEFNPAYIMAPYIDDVTSSIEKVESIKLPVGYKAYRVGFKNDPIEGVRVSVVLASRLNLRDFRGEAGPFSLDIRDDTMYSNGSIILKMVIISISN